ncbi:molybdate ABC transporter substrate-binding protein [Kineosporiaceae bacterium SCSIO 59966]|nr:molybdate ABC transporter substrate-binding protein [Kineosporiaceae bacterium SCSIO 59966]
MRPPRRLAALAGTVLLALAAVGCGPADDASSPADPAVVRVAAASDLQLALPEVLEEIDPDVEVAVTYGSSGQFVQQIVNGAPFDLYLSADTGYVDRLVEAEAAKDADTFTYATGRLVLWVPQASPIDPNEGLDVLTDPGVRRVALANPEHAPYGRAAAAALTAAGLDDDLADRIVLGENVSQTLDLVASGGADAGIVAASLVAAGPMADQGRWWQLPPSAHPPLVQGGAVLSGARDVEAAHAVREALLSAEGQDILRRYGFGPAPQAGEG